MTRTGNGIGSSQQDPGAEFLLQRTAMTTLVPPPGLAKVLNGTPAPHDNGTGKNEPIAMDEKVENLRRAMVDELCALRADVEVLKKGGWNVNVGPFQKTIEHSVEDRVQLHQSISERVGNKLAGHDSDGSDTEVETSKPASTSAISMLERLENVIPRSEFKVEPWKPAHIKSLKPLTSAVFPGRDRMVSFSWSFLQRIFLGATEHSPGLYYLPKSAGGCLLDKRTFYAISSLYEPFLPTKPCDHGAKMTAFFNPDSPWDGGETSYEDIPLFVSLSGNKDGEYTYMGTYAQSRWSDKLSHDVLASHVPKSVKEYWAAQLADPARPAWVTQSLMKHFFPMPEYEGPMPKSTPNGSAAEVEDEAKAHRKLSKAIKNHVEELRLWEIEAKNMVGLMKKEDMLKAFDKSDSDINPGLRLWWEYLECKKWDKGFYDLLVREQDKLNHARR